MKRKMNILLLTLFSVLSFFCTDKIIYQWREKDPIMQQIKQEEYKYKIEPINALMEGNTIISGKKGQEIDRITSFNNMKKYGSYNESLMTIKTLSPEISIENNYDKYIISGNKENHMVALVFLIRDNENLTPLFSKLEEKGITATFFVDGTFLEKNTSVIKENPQVQFEILSYEGEYNENFLKTSISYLENLTKQKAKYCFTEIENDTLLKLCKKLNLHTIKSKNVIKKELYKTIKNNLQNSMIIALEPNNYIEKELSSTLDYIQKKGYQIVSLNTLLSENN